MPPATRCAATRRISAGLRTTDLFGRWGGEEFAFLLPDTGLNGALTLAERIRAELAAQPVAFGDTLIPVTASLGVAGGPPQASDSLESYLSRADEALYRAKDEGRNRVRE